MCLYNAFGQREAKTCPALLIRFEGLKDGIDILSRNPTAAVFDLYGQDILLPAGSQQDGSFPCNGFLRILKKIQEYLFQLDLIACILTQFIRNGRGKLDIRICFIQRYGK